MHENELLWKPSYPSSLVTFKKQILSIGWERKKQNPSKIESNPLNSPFKLARKSFHNCRWQMFGDKNFEWRLQQLFQNKSLL